MGGTGSWMGGSSASPLASGAATRGRLLARPVAALARLSLLPCRCWLASGWAEPAASVLAHRPAEGLPGADWPAGPAGVPPLLAAAHESWCSRPLPPLSVLSGPAALRRRGCSCGLPGAAPSRPSALQGGSGHRAGGCARWRSMAGWLEMYRAHGRLCRSRQCASGCVQSNVSLTLEASQCIARAPPAAAAAHAVPAPAPGAMGWLGVSSSHQFASHLPARQICTQHAAPGSTMGLAESGSAAPAATTPSPTTPHL